MKKITFKLVLLLLILLTSACSTYPHYSVSYGYNYSVPPQPYYGYHNKPVRFVGPSYRYSTIVYDPLLDLGSAIIHGVGIGLGWALIHSLIGHQ